MLNSCQMITTRSIVLFVALISVQSCTLDEYKTANPKASKTVIQSKENGVFVKSVNYEKTHLKIAGSKSLKLSDVWIEKSWKYKGKEGDIEILEGYQLVIDMEQTELADFMETWSLCLNNDCQVGLRNGNIVFDGLPLLESYKLSSTTLKTSYNFKNYEEIDEIMLKTTKSTN